MAKIKCNNCGKKSSSKNRFCPYCGSKIQGENMGMLGKDDSIEESQDMFGNGFLNKLIKSTMKMIEKELQKDFDNEKKQHSNSIRLMVNGQEVDLGNKKNKKKTKNLNQNDLPSNKLSKFSKLPRKEPKINIRRLSDKIVYEISLPGVNSEKEISIIKLEESLEIKATSEKNSYYKVIPLNLPIKNYSLEEGKLNLEFSGNQ